jgi:hypothetical protein
MATALLLSGCTIDHPDSASPASPPDSWERTTAIHKSIVAGPLVVRLDSETCSPGMCTVSETVTNRSDRVASFPCSEQKARTSGGRVVDQFFVTLGSGGGGCSFDVAPGAASPWQIAPGTSRSYEARFYTEGDVGISRVYVPGGGAVEVPVLTYTQ